MKRENEFAVGVVVIVAFALVVGGALWLSGTHFGQTEAVYTARFRTLGGLGVGNPVALRGVRVGRVEAIRLAPGNWVEADLKIYSGVTLPQKPAVIAASASLFGEWAATLISSDPLPNDPNVRQALVEALAAGSGPGPRCPTSASSPPRRAGSRPTSRRSRPGSRPHSTHRLSRTCVARSATSGRSLTAWRA